MLRCLLLTFPGHRHLKLASVRSQASLNYAQAAWVLGYPPAWISVICASCISLTCLLTSTSSFSTIQTLSRKRTSCPNIISSTTSLSSKLYNLPSTDPNFYSHRPLRWTKLIHFTHTMSSVYPSAVAALLLAAVPVNALPLIKREMGTGAKAGMGVGIAVAAILVVGFIIFLIVHFRRVFHIKKINQERAILAGEKNTDGSDKVDKLAPEPQVSSIPRRQKSVKDRLMGPLYRGSVIDLHPLPKAKIPGSNSNRQSTMTLEGGDDQAFLHKPFAAGENSPRPSFSSKRATRMMMMM